MKLKNIIAITSVVVIIVATIYSYIIYKKVFSANTSFAEREVYIQIPTDATYPEAEQIIAQYVKDMEKFRMSAEKMDYPSKYRSGRFLVKSGMNNFDMIRSLLQNVPVRLTFNNQETLEDFAGRIAQQLEPDSLTLMQVFTEQEFLSQNNFTVENALSMYLPNTYEFYWNTTAAQFREKMAKEYRRFWTEERLSKADSLGLTPQEVSTLASIVQKETTKVDERPRVAGVYLNRLKIEMPLQADPTAVYAYKKHTGNFKEVIKRVNSTHTSINSPYNTYQVTGLPPGPITMPDISSIDAVLNAEKHDYYYFCASVERFGYHEFAKTHDQHRVNANKYQKWLNKQGY